MIASEMDLEIADRVAALIKFETSVLEPAHELTDPAKRDALAVDLLARGWVGAPIVANGPYALTGSHRLAAIDAVWDQHDIRMDVPRVDVRDLCEEFGADWDELVAEHLGDQYYAAEHLPDVLPAAVVGYLGLDLH